MALIVGEGLTAAVTQTIPDMTPPTVPQAVTASATSSTKIIVSWQASTDTGTGVAGYRVYRNGSGTILATVSSTTFTESNLKPSTLYSYRVRAFDAATPINVSARSAAASATTQADTTVPTVPKGVTASATSSTQIMVSWQASTDTGSGVAGYRVYRDGGATPAAIVMTGTSFIDTGLTPSTPYSYRVRAFDAATPANVSALSTAASATTQAPPVDTTKPTVPQGVTANSSSSTQILVSWQASTDAGTGVAGYRVYRNGSTTILATVTSTSYTNSNLTPSTTYSYRVRAFDAATPANVSALSAAATATTQAPTSTVGLDARPDNTTCVAGARPSQYVTLATERVFPNLPAFSSPILMLQAPGDASRWFVVEQGGTVRIFNNQANVSSTRLFVDITARVRSGGEQGLLGMAFHPGFPTDPRVYLSYTNATSGLVSRVSEFRTRDGGLTLDPTSEVILFTIAQPETNHNGGNIAFGPDGFLYAGFGDGGSGGDPHGSIGNGQDLTTLLGKLLRIDIGGSTGSVPYRIPANNPYAGNALCGAGAGTQSCPEIYAYGLRNPWRWSFDRGGTGELWLADVGQDTTEEVDRIVRGGNYGWRCFEGTNPYNSTCGPNAASSLPPVAQYSHSVGQSVTGGYVYRGTAIPALAGRYVFSDFGSGRIWHIAGDTSPTLTVTSGFDSGLSIASFAQGGDGELYIVNYGGTLYQLRDRTSGGRSVPSQLSATGCVDPADATRPASGLVPFAPNAAFWSDSAVKDRYLALPNGTTMSVGAGGDFDFPNGTVLMKHFRLGSKLIETRLFMRHTDGVWAGYSYEWNTQGTDATRVIGGNTAVISGQTWVFPSEAQCLSCHTAAAGRSLGLEIAQLNRTLLYPQTGRTANQIATLDAIGMFSPAIGTPPDQLPALPDPYGSSGTLGERARAYLHTNCSQCHRPGGGTPVDMDLRYSTTLLATNTCDLPPQAGDLGLTNARIIAPGAASRSVLVARANRRDSKAMPPLASIVVDAAGVSLLTRWVNSLTTCN